MAVALNEFTPTEREYLLRKLGYVPALPFVVDSTAWYLAYRQAKADFPNETSAQHQARGLAQVAWATRPLISDEAMPAMVPAENETRPVAGMLARIGREALYLFRGFAGVFVFVAVVVAVAVQSQCHR